MDVATPEADARVEDLVSLAGFKPDIVEDLDGLERELLVALGIEEVDLDKMLHASRA